MKVGILTLPLHTNYGGILQAYALQTIIERMGHDVKIIDRSPYKNISIYKKPLSYTKRWMQKYIQGKRTDIFIEKKYNKNYPIISQHIQPFIDKYINRLEVNNLSSLKESEFDAIVVGSDQIWRPSYYPLIENAYLKFASDWDIKRISYAASFGTDKWEYTKIQTQACANLLHKFDAVSVREISGAMLCKTNFDIDSKHVLDPTMLLDTEDYIQLIENANIPQSSGTLLNYILDETKETEELIQRIAEKRGIIPFRVNSKVEDRHAPINERIQPPIEQWLRGFHDAELIVTDSFHACVFAILFNKPFIVIGNKERGLTRFDSLLSTFNMQEKIINPQLDKIRDKSIHQYDRMDIGLTLNNNKEESLKFLYKALTN